MAECVRIDVTGNKVWTRLSQCEATKWLDYNMYWRPGVALFVNGQCCNRGYLTRERCQAYERELQESAQ